MTSTSRGRRARFATWTVAALVVADASPAAAHGIGERGDLPLPLWQVAWGAGIAVAISFAAIGALWHTPRLRTAAEGRPMPAFVERMARAATLLARLLVLTLSVLAVWSAFAGSDSPNRNLAPVTFYVVLWVGGQVSSAMLGDVWPAVSPIDTVAAAASWLRRRLGRESPSAPPDQAPEQPATHWPAAAGVLAFLWLELAYHDPGNPRIVGGAIVAASTVLLLGALRQGRRWLRTADPLGALFGLLAALAPFEHDADGTLRLRPPFVGLSRLVPRRGTVALVLVTLGGTGFDGVARTSWWGGITADRSPWGVTTLHTVALLAVIGLASLLYLGATRASGRITGDAPSVVADRYVASLLPITLAYAVAHYFSLLVFEGQRFVIVLSDPLARGWDLLGTATWRVDYRLVEPTAIAWVQVGAIVAGHVLGVAAAHDRAIEASDARTALRGQYPLLAVMVAYTVGGLLLLLNA